MYFSFPSVDTAVCLKQAHLWDLLIYFLPLWGWLASILSHTSSLPWLILQAHCISQECPHPDSCRRIWLIPLSVPIHLVSLTNTSFPCPLPPLLFESSSKVALPLPAIWVLVFHWWCAPTWDDIRDAFWWTNRSDRQRGKNLFSCWTLFIRSPVPTCVVWYVLPVMLHLYSWLWFNALLMQQHSPAPLYQCTALLWLVLTVWLQSHLKGCQPFRVLKLKWGRMSASWHITIQYMRLYFSDWIHCSQSII